MKAFWFIAPAAALVFLAARQPTPAQELAEWNGCFKCHGLTEVVSAPSFRDIATARKGQADGRKTLVQSILKGSKGKWAEISHGVPMPGYAELLSNEEANGLADWILSQ